MRIALPVAGVSLAVLAVAGCASSPGAVDAFVPTSHTVEYVIDGTTDGVNLTFTNEQGGTEQVNEKALPLVDASGAPVHLRAQMPAGSFAYVAAQNTRDSGTIGCKILVDGHMYKQSTSSGGYVIATCSTRL